MSFEEFDIRDLPSCSFLSDDERKEFLRALEGSESWEEVMKQEDVVQNPAISLALRHAMMKTRKIEPFALLKREDSPADMTVSSEVPSRRVTRRRQTHMNRELRYLMPDVKLPKWTVPEVYHSPLNQLSSVLAYLSSNVQVAECECSVPFRKPVSRFEAEDYKEVIEQPMDLKTMKIKLRQEKYLSKKSFKDDLDLIVENCLRYNNDDTIFVELAKRFRETYENLLSKVEDFSVDLYVGANEVQMDDIGTPCVPPEMLPSYLSQEDEMEDKSASHDEKEVAVVVHGENFVRSLTVMERIRKLREKIRRERGHKVRTRSGNEIRVPRNIPLENNDNDFANGDCLSEIRDEHLRGFVSKVLVQTGFDACRNSCVSTLVELVEAFLSRLALCLRSFETFPRKPSVLESVFLLLHMTSDTAPALKRYFLENVKGLRRNLLLVETKLVEKSRSIVNLPSQEEGKNASDYTMPFITASFFNVPVDFLGIDETGLGDPMRSISSVDLHRSVDESNASNVAGDTQSVSRSKRRKDGTNRKRKPPSSVGSEPPEKKQKSTH